MNNLPNLDAMSINELMSFWSRHQRGIGYKSIFPEGGKMTMKATSNLASYAANKATAMRCREHGEIQSAIMYESISDRIYDDLPDFAKW